MSGGNVGKVVARSAGECALAGGIAWLGSKAMGVGDVVLNGAIYSGALFNGVVVTASSFVVGMLGPTWNKFDPKGLVPMPQELGVGLAVVAANYAVGAREIGTPDDYMRWLKLAALGAGSEYASKVVVKMAGGALGLSFLMGGGNLRL